MTFNMAGGRDYTLGASIGSTDTTITLSSFLEPVSDVPYTMALLNTDIVYGTIAPGTSSSEFISFTGITQNADGTATLTGVTRGLAKKYPFTESSTFKLPHSGQSIFILSDAPQLFKKFGTLDNDEVITGYWEGLDPVTSQGLVTRDYMLNLINGGTISVAAVIEEGIAGETVAAGNLLYFSETDNEWLKTDADTLATLFNVKLGIAKGAGVNGGTISGGVHTYGVYVTTGLTQGDLLYASNTAGAIANTPGTTPRVIGIAKDSTHLYFDPNFQNKLYDYAVDAVGTDAYAVTMPAALSVYFPGMEINFKAGTTNTGACTLSVNGGAAKSIVKDSSSALVTGDILANQIVKVIYDGTNFQIISNTPQLFGDFGDGSDGDVTISGTTTLTSDMYYNNLTVTGTLNTANWRVFVKGTLSGNGNIQNNGGAGGNAAFTTAGAAGAKIADGYFVTLPGYAGGTGLSSNGAGPAGTAGGSSSTSIGVVGVAGGAGGAGDAFAGGTGGAAGARTAVLQKFGINKWQTISGIDFALAGTTTKYNGSSGSGSGGAGGLDENGNTGTSGGGGGSGAPGGILALFVNNFTGTATISARGGNGGNGGDGVVTAGPVEAGGGGGGAGGSGGHVYVVYKSKTWTGSYNVSGGTGGAGGAAIAGSGGGLPGSAGTTGTTGTTTEINISTLL